VALYRSSVEAIMLYHLHKQRQLQQCCYAREHLQCHPGLTGSVMMTPNLPSTLMSNVRTSQLTHCGSCSACVR